MSQVKHYHQWSEKICKKHKAIGVIVIVVGGDLGTGVAVQWLPAARQHIPEVLRDVTAKLEKQIKGESATNGEIPISEGQEPKIPS